jgi:hypothetical protein
MTLPQALRKGAKYRHSAPPPETTPANAIYQSPGLKPLNATAAAVIAPGEQYTPDKNASGLMWFAPPPMVDLKTVRWRGPNGDKPKDWTGTVMGRLTVIGYWRYNGNADKKGKGPVKHQWICRCLCGMFIMRNARTIKKASEREHVYDACDNCRHLHFLKKNEYFHRTGRRWDDENKARKKAERDKEKK